MTANIGSTFNQLESRLSRLEATVVRPTTGLPDLAYDDETQTTTVEDPLDWTASPTGWEPYSTISPLVLNDDTGEFTGGLLSSPYGQPQAHLIGSMCVLTGMVRRKAGATTLSPGTRYNVPMFGLPVDWRPITNIILPCLMGNTAPDSTASTTVGTAWVEVKPDIDPVQVSGRVHFVAGTVTLAPGTGWIALQGIFPCSLSDTSTPSSDPDSWDNAHFQSTWNDLGDSVTWNTYTNAG